MMPQTYSAKRMVTCGRNSCPYAVFASSGGSLIQPVIEVIKVSLGISNYLVISRISLYRRFLYRDLTIRQNRFSFCFCIPPAMIVCRVLRSCARKSHHGEFMGHRSRDYSHTPAGIIAKTVVPEMFSPNLVLRAD